MTRLEGRVWLFGDDVNTDNISPTRYAADASIEENAAHTFADVRPEFAPNCKPGDYVVAGYNFGCGSLREFAVRGFKGLNVGGIIARSFARGFIRNAINMGVWLIIIGDAEFDVEDGDILEADVKTGFIINKRTGQSVQGKPFTGLGADILEAGGAPSYFKSMVVYPAK